MTACLKRLNLPRSQTMTISHIQTIIDIQRMHKKQAAKRPLLSRGRTGCLDENALAWFTTRSWMEWCYVGVTLITECVINVRLPILNRARWMLGPGSRYLIVIMSIAALISRRFVHWWPCSWFWHWSRSWSPAISSYNHHRVMIFLYQNCLNVYLHSVYSQHWQEQIAALSSASTHPSSYSRENTSDLRLENQRSFGLWPRPSSWTSAAVSW